MSLDSVKAARSRRMIKTIAAQALKRETSPKRGVTTPAPVGSQALSSDYSSGSADISASLHHYLPAMPTERSLYLKPTERLDTLSFTLIRGTSGDGGQLDAEGPFFTK
jgi:hypothetical protein